VVTDKISSDPLKCTHTTLHATLLDTAESDLSLELSAFLIWKVQNSKSI